MANVGGLKGLRIPTRTVSVADGVAITVRGLSFTDISHLVAEYAPAMKGLFAELVSGGLEDVSSSDAMKFASVLLKQAPDLAAAIIAHASGEPDSMEEANTLPFPAQLELLEAVALLTFATEGGAKKVLETVIRLAQGVNGLIADLRT